MKLSELLQKITPLPWGVHDPMAYPRNSDEVAECEANEIYSKHASNCLPELVQALNRILLHCDCEDTIEIMHIKEIAKAASSRAETVLTD